MQRRIITVEGNIGSGKTSFAKKLAAAYNAKLILETFADNPFLQKFFVKQQDYALGMEMFFMAERYEQLKSELTEAENINDIFVIDYLFTKSLLYAKVNLDDAEYGLYQKIFNILNPKVLSVKEESLKKIEEVYLNEFERFADQTTLILDVSNADFVAVDADFQKMLVLIDKQHEPGIHRYTI